MHSFLNDLSSYSRASEWLTETTTTCHEKEIGMENPFFYGKKVQIFELTGSGYVTEPIEQNGVFDSSIWSEMEKIPPLFPEIDDLDYTSADAGSEGNKRPLSSHHDNCDESGNSGIFTEKKMNEPDEQTENSTEVLRSVKKSFQCEYCEKSFRLKNTLTIHIRTHTGDRPYKCKVCEKSFNQSINLIKHTRTHTGDRPYKCRVCEKSFNQSCNLIRHTRTHTGNRPYKCKVCEKSFIQSSNLINHTRTHTGDRPYKCELCEKSFIQSSNLINHTRTTHTGDRPYKCELCETSFALKSTLTRHSKSQRHLRKQAQLLTTELPGNTGGCPLDRQIVKPVEPLCEPR